jgi:AAA15 family ATPase/GTPase
MLNLYDESQGTLKSIVIFIISSSVIQSGGLMVVDELNIKLHPLLLKFVIDLFKNEKSRAQLVYTTHDTTLLDTKFFRRDQVWFVEKDDFGYSKLTALSDFKIRSDASFEKDYLSGVYGGIPTLLNYTMEAGE